MSFTLKIVGKIIGDRKSKNKFCLDCNEEHKKKDFFECKTCGALHDTYKASKKCCED
jgi:hypothetical protein